MNDLSSLLFYILSFVMSFFLYYLYNKHDKKILLYLSFLIPMLIGGLRYYVGTDYGMYVEMYNYNSYVNLGFSIIKKISSYFGGVNALFFIYNFLTLLFVFLGLKNIDKKARPIAYLCYLFVSYTYSFNIIRQALAIAIVFYAYKYVINKDFKRWLIFILLAYVFHSTSLLFLPFYFLINTKSNKLRFLIVILTMVLSYNYINIINYLSNTSLFNHYGLYATEMNNTANNRMFFVDFLLLIYFLLNKKNISKIDENSDIYIFLFSIGIALELTGFFNPYVKRIAEYFLISRVYLLPQIPLSQKKAKNKLLHTILIFTYCLLIFVISVYILKQANIIPYRWLGGTL